MRITNRMVTSKYIRSLNTVSTDLNNLNNKVSSGRAFTKASENTSGAIRAFQIRRDLSKTEGYQSNIEYAKSTLDNSESAIYHIEELVQNSKTQILQGMNGTVSTNERAIIATELRNIQDQILETLNSSASDVYLFGGSTTDSKPFQVVAGKLNYNGYPLDLPLPAGTALENSDLIKKLETDSRYMDIGLNVKFDASGNVDRTSVFNYSIPGIKIVGSGTTDLGGVTASNNLYDLLGQIASEFENPNYNSDTADKLYGHLQKSGDKVIHGLTEVGSKASYLEFMINRLEIKNINDQERQLAIEGADPAETIIHFKSQEAAYNAALQMGTKIIQPSIFDFMS